MLNVQTISTGDLRDNLAEVLEMVAIGKKSFLVSKFGKHKAILSPVTSQKTSKKIDFLKFKAYGIWKNKIDINDSSNWVSAMRQVQSKRLHING